MDIPLALPPNIHLGLEVWVATVSLAIAVELLPFRKQIFSHSGRGTQSKFLFGGH